VSIIASPESCAERAAISSPPRGKWKWSQQWRDVLFLHWPASHAWLRRQLPSQLEIDTFEDQAWGSFVGFHLQGMPHRLCPPVPFLTGCLELNFRSYVRYRGEPGICFLTMHADRWAVVAAARCLTPLPYALGVLQHGVRDDGHEFTCAVNEQTVLSAAFRPHCHSFYASADSLDAWLVERYVAYVADLRGRLYRMPVEHPPWLLQDIAVDHCEHALAGAVSDPNMPVRGHYSTGVSSLLWPLSRVPG